MALEYDHRNRLVHVTRSSAGGIVLDEASYTYDVFDRLIVRTVNGATTVTVYDGNNAWADYTVTGDVVTRYLHGDQADELLARWRPVVGLAWYVTDRQGSVREILDGAGSALNHIDYSTFGVPLVSRTKFSAHSLPN